MDKEGKMIFTDGTIYQGTFLNGKRNGKGEYKSKDLHYIGNWLNGKMHGEGILVFLADESSYDGNFENDKREGYGKHIYKSEGSTYEGNWYNDMKHGQGKITYKDGSTYEGFWYNDLPRLNISDKVLGDSESLCLKKWETNDIILLYNPKNLVNQKYLFNVETDIDNTEGRNICNYMFLSENLKKLKELTAKQSASRRRALGLEGDVEEEKIENPYTREPMDPRFIKPYILSIIKSTETSEGGKRKRKIKSKRKQTNKRKQKNKSQTKKKTKRKLH
jgi:hypothetical protein